MGLRGRGLSLARSARAFSAAPAISKIGGPGAWTAESLQKNKWWGYELSKAHLDEIDSALSKANKSGEIVWDGDVPVNVGRDNFALSGVAEALSEMADDLENGAGATMIANMPIDKYSEAELGLIYLGMVAHIGQWVPQSSAGLRSKSRGYGMPLGKIRAEMHGDTPLNGKQSNNYFRLHTDRCDVISLLSIRTASAGGESRIASAIQIHDMMVERYPHLVPLLYNPIQRIWEGGSGITSLPVFAVCPDGKFTTQISPSYIENAQVVPGVRQLTEDEIDAIDLIEELGLEVGHRFLAEPGQMMFLNNHMVYHGRTAWKFEGEQKDEGEGRLLLRTWVSPFNSRQLPDTPEMREVWGSIEAGSERGGLEPAVRAGLSSKPQELQDALNSGEYEYYGLYKRKFEGQGVSQYA